MNFRKIYENLFALRAEPIKHGKCTAEGAEASIRYVYVEWMRKYVANLIIILESEGGLDL